MRNNSRGKILEQILIPQAELYDNVTHFHFVTVSRSDSCIFVRNNNIKIRLITKRIYENKTFVTVRRSH